MPKGYKWWRRVFNWLEYRRELIRFRDLSAAAGRQIPLWRERFPILGEKTRSKEFDRHYVYHTAWGARILEQTRPTRHVDISSSLYFVGIVSAFVPIEHYDYRPPQLRLDNVTTGFADLLALPFSDRSIQSLSCMHVVEHVGLGRYGDQLDPDGDTKAMRELARVLAPGGMLLFVVPVGRSRVCFNAHRIYSYDQVRACFYDLRLDQFILIPDQSADGGLVDATAEMVAAQEYACGCFCFRRLN